MKIIFVFIFSILFLSIAPIKAQEIDWDKISFGASAQFSATEGDLNKFWGNIFSGGILFQYKLDEKFVFEAGIAGSYLKPDEDNQNKIPNIVFINSQALLKYYLITKGTLSFNISPGFTNTTFVFTGDAAEKVDDNFIEHEFGICFSSGIEFILVDELWVETYLSGQNIFSSPDNIALYSFGLKFILK